METLTEKMTCRTCGGPLARGPFGLRCAPCVLSLVEEVGSEEDGYVAELFPELHLEERIAKGGFGAVYRAEHRRMRRPVALKFLDTLLARNPEAVALFEQEMISVGGLDHPGIVRAHDAGERDGHWYIVMEFVDGLDCGALVWKHGHLPMAESCEIIRQAALALHHAHGKGLVHRDVKPGNVMVGRGNESSDHTGRIDRADQTDRTDRTDLVKVLDFGLAGLAVAPVFSQPVTTGGPTLVLGTLEYISPEQIESPDKVDARADLYSLGATLWRLLTGKTPHGGASPEISLFIAMKRITSEPVPSLATVRPDLPKPLIQLCDAMLSLDREKRPASAVEVARLLEPWCAGAELPRLFKDGPLEENPFILPKRKRRPFRTAAAAIVIAALAALSANVFLRPGSAAPGASPAPAAPDPAPYRPLFSEAYIKKENISPDSSPRLYPNKWEPEFEYHDLPHKQFARLNPDGTVLSVDYKQDHPIRYRDKSNSGKRPAFLFPQKPSEILALGIGPEGHVVWAMPGDNAGLHIGRARPDGSLLPTLRYDFAPEFSLGPLQLPSSAYELGRQMAINTGRSVADGEPRGFAFVTPENLPAGSDLRPGDVVVADFGQREFFSGMELMPGTQKRVGNLLSLPGLWRFRLDNDEPARRLAKGKPAQMFLDVTVSKQGVFALDRVFSDPDIASTTDPRHLTEHLWRWDGAAWHACTTDQPLLNPCGIAADPLSADLYILCGHENFSRSTERQSIQRLTPAGPHRYTVTPLVIRLGATDRGGIAISYDGKRMIVTDSGSRVIVVLKRKD